uniref:Cerebellin 20 n=1 Tax=Myripristis murdjan TaxID=586833 RepID=A0A667Y253_9TELE
MCILICLPAHFNPMCLCVYICVCEVCLTDHASCGCCLMQQQLYRMESFFNMSLNELQRDLERAENVLNDIRATRSAFSVALTNDRWCLGPFRDVVPVVYQHVFINLAGSYSIQTGKFIVPRSGVYSFSLTVYSDAGSAGNTLAACASLYHNNILIAGPSDRNAQDQEDSSTSVVALHANAGDEVHVKLPIGCYLCDNNSHFNTFSGFLLYATD